MAKTATVKDVLYALQYGGAQLVRHRQANPTKPAAWSLEPGGVKVPARVADEGRRSLRVVASSESRHGETRYQWVAAE
jgi:hypothetical protein